MQQNTFHIPAACISQWITEGFGNDEITGVFAPMLAESLVCVEGPVLGTHILIEWQSFRIAGAIIWELVVRQPRFSPFDALRSYL